MAIHILQHEIIKVFLLAVAMLIPESVIAKTATEIFDARSSSIAMVAAMDQTGNISSRGTGVLLSDGVVATNCHVIRDADQIRVVHQQKDYPAAVRHSDWDRDVCTLTVKGWQAPAAPLGSTKTLKAGAKVYVIGAPQRLALTLAEGIISGLRHVEAGRYLQFQAPLSSRSRGGCLFDEDGRLVGLTTFYRAKSQNQFFAIPVEWIGGLTGRQRVKAAQADSLVVWLSRAMEMEENRSIPALIDHCRRWVKRRPKDVHAWYGLGEAYKEAGQTAKAIEAWRKAVEIKPQFADTWLLLAKTYRESGQPDKAIEAFWEETRINPEAAQTWFLMGITYKESGQPDKAVEAWREAVRIDPEFGQAWFLLGLHYTPGRPDKAAEAFREAVRINSKHADAWYGLGLAYGQSERPEMEIEAYLEALRIDPRNADVLYSLGAAYLVTGQTEKAAEVHQRLKGINVGKAAEFYEKYLTP